VDWQAFRLSLLLGIVTALILLPAGVLLARTLAWRRFPGRSLVLGLVALPLVLPPTVLGYYLLTAFGPSGILGSIYERMLGEPLVFSFEGLVVASLIVNVPFAIQPMQHAFEAIPQSLREAAWCSGLSPWKTEDLLQDRTAARMAWYCRRLRADRGAHAG
jgi:molybdate transport system permease protein